MTHDDRQRRGRDYERWRWVASAIGAAPLLSVYLLVHTPHLRSHLPEAKWLAALILICVPLGWMFGVARLYEWWGARRFGLPCPKCGRPLGGEALERALARGACRRCAATDR